MTDFDPDDLPHLENLITGGLMRKITPPEIEAKFLRSGYARKAVGGLVATETAQKIFWENQHGGKKNNSTASN